MISSPARLPAPNLPAGPRSALVIATTSYDDPLLRQLRAPATDALELAAVLADPAIGGFEVTSVVDRLGHEVRMAIEEFLAGRTPEDLVVVYFSCHGVTDARRRLHFAATDTSKSRLASTGVDSVWVYDRMEECRARRQVLILDCCFSGAFARGAKGAEAVGLDQFTEPGRGRAVLTASNATEYSFETPTSGQPTPASPVSGSIFTAALLAGLRDGSADRDGDGFVTVDEAYAYAYQQVRASGAAQTPQRWLSGGEGQLLLARNPAGRPVIPVALPESLWQALQSPLPNVRIGAVAELSDWLASDDPARVVTALRELEDVAENDILRVAATARSALERDRPPLVFLPSSSARLEEEQAGQILREAEEQSQLDVEEQAQREEAAHYERAGPEPAEGGIVEVTEPEPEDALVEGVSEVSEARPDQPAGSSREPRFTSRRMRVLVTIAVVAVAASAVWLLIRSESGNPGKAPTVAVAPNTSSPPASTTTAPGPTVPQAAAALPNNVIVFPEGTKDNEDIWTVRADGSEHKLLVGNPGTDTWPVISHDRKTVLYVHIEKGAQTLRVVSVDGKGDRLFADVGSICKLTSRPAWSSTGMIAVVCVEGPRIHSIKLVNTHGTVERTLVPPVDYVEDPAFSNDGKFVVYWKEPSTNEVEGGPLYRIGVDGHGERRITDGEPGQDADPAWSPDDDRIAFRRRVDPKSARDIWILNVRTGESRALVTGPSNDQDPSWSPDGRHLVYKCGPNGDADICLVDADGRNPHRLFQSDEPNTAPAWTPR
jgi:Tol biopolymer transport system component